MNFYKRLRFWVGIGMFPFGVNAVFAGNPYATYLQENEDGSHVLSGVVSDESGNPLPGVSVVVVGTSLGTITDYDGKYTLNLPHTPCRVRYSFIGLEPQEVTVNNTVKVQHMTLKTDAQLLEDVVVIGYGNKNRKSLTSSIVSVKKEDMEKLSHTSTTVQNMLGGTIKGVLVTQNSGEPGATLSINVRGVTSPYPITTSLTANNAPLYVIDGVPMFVEGNALNPLLNVSPGDIESIDVLKDASATAIYGSRGANGVIIVTTKSGRKGEKVKVEAGYTLSIGNPVKEFAPLDNREFRMLHEEILVNSMRAYNESMTGRVVSTNVMPDLLMKYGRFEMDPQTMLFTGFQGLNPSAFGAENVNWNREIRNRNALTHQYNVSVRGGSEKTDYSFSFNGINQDGLYKYDHMDTYGARMSLNTAVSERVRAGVLMSYSNSSRKSPSQESILQSDTHAWLVRPDRPVYDENGDFVRIDYAAHYDLPEGVTVASPVALLERKSENVSDQFMGNVYLDIDILKDLKLHADFTMASYNYSNRYFYPGKTQELWQGMIPYSTLSTNRSKYTNTSVNFRADYSRYWNRHLLGVMLGYGADRSVSRGEAFTFQGFPNDDYLNNVGSAQHVLSSADFVTKSGLNSLYGRVSYDYAGRYLLEASLRADASSKFGPGNQWGVFPAVSAGWMLSEEDFLKRTGWIDELKLRLSWGQTGSTNVSSFSYRQYYTAGQYGNSSSVRLQDLLPNEGIHWEKTHEVNLGLDFTLFSGRLYGGFDVYYRYTAGSLAPAPHILESGMKNYYDNIIDVSNRGLEWMMGGYPVRTKDFSWMSDLNLAVNRNRIESLNNAQIAVTMQDAFLVGMPAGTVKGYVVDHIIQDVEELAALNEQAQQKGFANYQNGGEGDFLMRDMNGDGTISADDRVVIANPEAKLFGGWTNTFTYRNWSLSVLMQFQWGGQALYSNLNQEAYGFLGQSVGRELFGNTWTPERRDARYARLVASPYNMNYLDNDRYVFETSYLRMKNVTLSYALPERWMTKAGVARGSLFVSATNLLTLTGWPGLDPETIASGITSMGTNSDPYPLSRTFSVGVNLQF